MLRVAFFGFMLAAVVSVALQFLGFRAIEITILLIISALILSEIMKVEEREEMESLVKEDFTKKLEGMEKILNYIFKKVENLLTTEHIEEIERRVCSKLETKESELKRRFKDEIGKISKKIMEIEARLNELREHSFSLHKRVESMENYIFEEEEI